MNINTNVNTYTLYSQPYLDTRNQMYVNIITINLFPKGPISSFVRNINMPRLSEFGPYRRGALCGLGFISLSHFCLKTGCDLMTVDEFPGFLSILKANNYEINMDLTQMVNPSQFSFQDDTGKKILCFITYKG